MRSNTNAQRTVVVSVVRRVVVVSPYGDIMVPLVVVLLRSTTTPSGCTVRCVVLSTTVGGATGMTGTGAAVVDSVVVVVTVCATATPVINVRAVVIAKHVLIMAFAPYSWWASGYRPLAQEETGACDIGSRRARVGREAGASRWYEPHIEK
jgi:hypothetical protein